MDQPTIAAVLAILDRLIDKATHPEPATKNLYNMDVAALGALRRARVAIEELREKAE